MCRHNGNETRAYILLALFIVFHFRALAQSPDVTVQQAMRASAAPGLDMVCDERSTILSFVNGSLRSQELQEAIVSTPRRGQGTIALDTSYRELLRVNGKPVSSARGRDSSTANMTTGGAWLGSTSGWVFSHRSSFDFKTGGLEKPNGLTESLLVLQFERKKGSEDPWFVPDSGTLWLDPNSKRLVRLEIHDKSLAPMLAREAARTII